MRFGLLSDMWLAADSLKSARWEEKQALLWNSSHPCDCCTWSSGGR
ncbi:hypothetical protein MPTK1_6g21260 [Marchantia polymorpha subsp. ruderalis]|uniref:Uncharacterized protein n=2 Tax=Marchantia polymorpha TaxID=3197 RepID=A0AAF6BUG3_MARPO|nr:hypothetical protein MARPO_0091s0029 [Marchantia polymorpha]BBN15647.1 hypothetical protein Mp_6g21260 [Marchantia polymorpha subsp. ruderalis]|eukprot:PTQ33167.1 hypothetical protein MARPO_0091s0029 [Marchantia polymorpha]